MFTRYSGFNGSTLPNGPAYLDNLARVNVVAFILISISNISSYITYHTVNIDIWMGRN